MLALQPSRAHMFRSWGSVIGMLPAGGNAVWGNLSWAPDDSSPMKKADATYGCVRSHYTSRYLATCCQSLPLRRPEMRSAVVLLGKGAGPLFPKRLPRWGSHRLHPQGWTLSACRSRLPAEIVSTQKTCLTAGVPSAPGPVLTKLDIHGEQGAGM